MFSLGLCIIMQAYEYRMKWYGEDEKTAREKVGTPAEVIE